jgi:NAD(P)-dependent dehydrogenase (short-subunit alcohol dehydrogenase family)
MSPAKRDYPIAMQITGELGTGRVNNNASDPAQFRSMLSDTDCEDLERAFDTNVIGPFRLTKALLGARCFTREARGAC